VTKRSSPVIVKPIEMDFPEALRVVIEGKKITKLDWENRDTYISLRGGFLSLYQDGKWHRLLVSDGDLLGQDWVTVNDTKIN